MREDVQEARTVDRVDDGGVCESKKRGMLQLSSTSARREERTLLSVAVLVADCRTVKNTSS